MVSLFKKVEHSQREASSPERESIISFELSSCRVLLSGTCSLILLFNQTVQCFYWGPWGLLLVLGRRWFEFAQRRMFNTVNQNVFCLSIRRIVTTRMRSFSHNRKQVFEQLMFHHVSMTITWKSWVGDCFYTSISIFIYSFIYKYILISDYYVHNVAKWE